MEAVLIFPHQLFQHAKVLSPDARYYLYEDPLYFRQFPFHKNKLVLHRASMQIFAADLQKQGKQVTYCDILAFSNISSVVRLMKREGITHLTIFDPVDDWQLARLQTAAASAFPVNILPSPAFLCGSQILDDLLPRRKHYRMADFYEKQRIRLNILMDEMGNPTGGKWSYDVENRKKYNSNIPLPTTHKLETSSDIDNAKNWVEEHFQLNYGVTHNFHYAVDRTTAISSLKHFLYHSLAAFGDYQDAMDENEAYLFHSNLSYALNIGLITPDEVVAETLAFADSSQIPLNSLEGFLRQIIGWREFVRGIYVRDGGVQRTTNFFGFTRKIPAAFWNGSTGIDPIDIVIKRVISSGYCHHIERLMLFGAFFLLCEFAPDEVYKWFMTLFIDAYDWVMVPNVYGMSQYADGGLMTTKPYLCGSAYILKMSNFRRGEWCEIWDGLYWRFVNIHRDMLLKNPRTSMSVRMFDKMSETKKAALKTVADRYILELDALNR